VAVEPPKPWERQPGEGPEAFDAFVAYRDMPTKDRSLTAAYRRYTGGEAIKASGTWMNWSVEWRWRPRTLAWDDENDRLKREAHRDAIVKMSERQAATAQYWQGVAYQQMQALLERLQDDGPAAADARAMFGPTALTKMLVDAAKLERLARGVPTDLSWRRWTRRNWPHSSRRCVRR
jgi:hypothetical protein